MKNIILATFSFFIISTLHGQPLNHVLKFYHLSGDFYIYESFGSYQGQRIGANAMYLVTKEGVVLFDTPWDTAQFQNLLDSIAARHHQKVIMCIATHFHEDRSGGLEYYRAKGIKTFTTRKTDSISKIKGMKRAEYLIDKDTTFHIGQYTFQTIYPGEGHTWDNIVIWFPVERILYGGCLIKSASATSLGNLSEANINAYAQTIRNVQSRCRNPKYIITGHDDWTDTNSLKHTLKMAIKLNK